MLRWVNIKPDYQQAQLRLQSLVYFRQSLFDFQHYNDVIMASQITSLTIVYSVYPTVYSKRRSKKASLAFVRGIHRWPENGSIWWRHHECFGICLAADQMASFNMAGEISSHIAALRELSSRERDSWGGGGGGEREREKWTKELRKFIGSFSCHKGSTFLSRIFTIFITHFYT